jgi:hypothetical protein
MFVKKSDNPESSDVLQELWASIQLAGHSHQTNEANVPSNLSAKKAWAA